MLSHNKLKLADKENALDYKNLNERNETKVFHTTEENVRLSC